MRNLASSIGWWILAAVLAVAAVVAVAMGVLAVRPAPWVATKLVAPDLRPPEAATLELPRLLPPLRTANRVLEASASPSRSSPDSGAVLAKLEGVVATPRGGVLAVLDGRTGAHLRSQKLGSATAVPLSGIPAGTHWLVVADDERDLRYGYRARTKVVVAAAQDTDAALDCAHGDLIVKLAPELLPESVEIRRADDAAWICPPANLAFTSGTRPTSSGAAVPGRLEVHGLGHGRYTVRLRDSKSAPIEVTIPGTREIALP